AFIVKFFLVDNGVNSDGGFTRLTVADDQLALSASDRNHRVNRFDTCLQRLIYRATEDNAGRFTLQRHLIFCAFDFAFAVNRLSERIHYATYHTFAHFDRSDSAGTAHRGTFANAVAGTHQYHPDVVFFEVQNDGFHAGLKLNQFTCLYAIESVHTCNTVAHLQYRTYFFHIGSGCEAGELLFEYRTYFIRFYINHGLEYLKV